MPPDAISRLRGDGPEPRLLLRLRAIRSSSLMRSNPRRRWRSIAGLNQALSLNQPTGFTEIARFDQGARFNQGQGLDQWFRLKDKLPIVGA